MTEENDVIREHDEPRGRRRGEMAQLLLGAACMARSSSDGVEVVLDELDAIQRAIDIAAPGDLVVLMVYRVERAWEAVRRRAAEHKGKADAAARPPIDPAAPPST